MGREEAHILPARHGCRHAVLEVCSSHHCNSRHAFQTLGTNYSNCALFLGEISKGGGVVADNSAPGRGTESMLGSRGSKSDTSSGSQEGRSMGPGLDPQ